VDAFALSQSEVKANAAFIVRACNSHDDMLEALKGLIDTFNPDKQASYEFARIKINAALAAIGKAAGENI
jgi:hypothetical protein